MRNNMLLQQLLFVIVKLVGFQFETRSKSKVDCNFEKKAKNNKNTTTNVGIYTRSLARNFHEELDDPFLCKIGGKEPFCPAIKNFPMTIRCRAF